MAQSQNLSSEKSKYLQSDTALGSLCYCQLVGLALARALQQMVPPSYFSKSLNVITFFSYQNKKNSNMQSQ